MRPRVLVTEPISREGMAVLSASLDVDEAFETCRAELLERIADFDALVVRSRTRVDREVLERAERLRVVGRAGVGVDNIDIALATSRGVMVVNAPESNVVSAAEHTLAFMLALARNLPGADRELRSGVWPTAKPRGVELLGKTLGVVGLGRVGSAVAVRASAFGMDVVAYDPYISDDRFRNFGAEKMDTLDSLLERSDYVSVHTPRTDETYGMIGERELRLAPEGVRIINCARGGIVVEDALVAALRSGHVAAAGIDVFDGEPVTEHPLFGFDQVLVTPHLGGSTEEAQVRVGETVAGQVVEALAGSVPRYALNIPLADVETLAHVGPFMPLAEALGSAFTQLFGLPTAGVEITYAGEIARYRTELPTQSFLKGLLTPVLGDEVNLVNGRYLASEKGIDFTESRTTDAPSYQNLITVEGADASRGRLSATLLEPDGLRMTEIDGFEVDLVPAGDILVAWFAGGAVEEPGIVGRVGTMLGEAGVNISRMEVGREVVRGRAIMIISPGGEVPESAVELLSSHEGVSEVRLIRLDGRVRKQ
ncbi:MAG: phosphoglycerate dehydrogenase [Candidatus Eisenbacteria bacterium]|nr:phosphoglycerate dehydrogenase [Candidatus Eisenbacteria bacterium]